MSMPRIAFFGTPEFSARLLEHIITQKLAEVLYVVCQPDRPHGRSQKTLPPPVKSVAEKFGIPVLQPTSVRKELEMFTATATKLGIPDLNLVVAFGQILPKTILDSATNGSCNIHASLLPRWRGAAPIQRAIQSGDTETGICLMQMDEGLDTGGVFFTGKLPVTAEETFASLHDRLCVLSQQMLSEHLHEIAFGKQSAVAQLSEGVTYAQKILSAEARIDWTKPAVEIERMLRAFDPAPGAFSMLEGKRLKIFKAMLLGRNGESASAGQVIAHDKSGLLVACGDGNCLLLQELQMEGKRRQNSHEFGNGTTVEKGAILT